jgi:uncharacterized protein YndB with AHSA1/START domain
LGDPLTTIAPGMGPVSAEIEIDAPREEVFATIGDLARRPSFTDHFLTDFHLTRIESSGIGAGARFRVSLPLRSVWMDTAIVELEEPHRLLERGRGGRGNRIPSTTVWELTEGTGSLTRVRVSHWTEPSNPLRRWLEIATASSIWVQRGWRTAMRRLRDQLERGGPSPPPLLIAGGNPYPTGVP